MLPYLTPQRYRSMGFGTTDQSDEYLRSLINRASLAVDRYCSVPMVPQRYSFRGGTITNEEHEFYLGNGVNEPQQRRFWPRSKPLKSVQSVRVYVTNSQYLDFNTDELFVTHDAINITSLTVTQVGLFGNFTVPVIGLATPIAKLSYTYGYEFTATEEFVEPTDGQLYRAQNQFWTDDDVVVEVSGTPVTTGFTVDRLEGTVKFEVNQPAGTVVQVTYTYSLPNEVSQATGLTVADFIGKKELVEKGMSGVQSIRVGEISIDRPRPRAATTNSSVDVPNEAKQLLGGLQFISAAA
jgi:hypothetical protein